MIIFVSMSDRGAMFHHRRGWQKQLAENFHIKYKFFARKNSSHYKFLFRILIKIIHLKPKSIIFINGEYNPFLLIVHFISYFTSTKVIFSWHDVTPHNGSLFNYLQWVVAYINCLFCSRVIIYNKKFDDCFFLSGKYIYLPLPPIVLSEKFFIDSSIKKNGALVFFGRVEYYKGLDRVLECYLLKEVNKKLRQLLIIGNCPQDYKYKDLFKNSDRVIFLGPLSDLDAYNCMLSSDAILMPYRHCSQSFNPYWAGLTQNALVISHEVDHSLSIARLPGVYTFSDHTQLLNYIDINSKLIPFNHEFYSFSSGLSTLSQLCNE